MLSGWGGTAIVVDASSSRPVVFLNNALKRLSWLGVPVAIVVLVVWRPWARRQKMRWIPAAINRGVPAFFFAVTVFSCFWALFFNASNPSHPIRNLDTVRFISCQQSLDKEIDQVKWTDLSDVTLVDARLSNAYRHAHLKGAINVPIALSGIPLKRALETLDRRKRIVVYCQSRQCSWAQAMCQRLNCLGYDVAVLEGGVIENTAQLVFGTN